MRAMAVFPDRRWGLISDRVDLDHAPDALRHQRGIKQVVTIAA